MESQPRHLRVQLICRRSREACHFWRNDFSTFSITYRLEYRRIFPGGPGANMAEKSQGEGAARFTPGFCSTLAFLHSTSAVAAAYGTGSPVAAAAVEVWAR